MVELDKQEKGNENKEQKGAKEKKKIDTVQAVAARTSTRILAKVDKEFKELKLDTVKKEVEKNKNKGTKENTTKIREDPKTAVKEKEKINQNQKAKKIKEIYKCKMCGIGLGSSKCIQCDECEGGYV